MDQPPLIDIYPREGERSFFCGKTGSGKTFAMLRMALRFQNQYQIQILATKEDDSLIGLRAPIVRNLSEINHYKFPEYPVVVYYPTGAELKDKDILDGWCEWIYQRGNTVALIDELTQVAYGTIPREGFLDLYTRGRSQNVTVIAGTQRPVLVPPIVYTEAENFYKFYLSWVNDRKKVMEFSAPGMLNQVRDKHGFHFYNPNRSNYVYYIKSLPRG